MCVILTYHYNFAHSVFVAILPSAVNAGQFSEGSYLGRQQVLKAFLYDETGATMIEYGLIAALVSVAAIAALTLLGGSLTGIFTGVASILTSV